MSQLRNKQRNNIRAGIFVSISLTLGLVVFFILTDAWSRMTTNTSSYKVTFSVSEGIGTLASGSKVRLGGVLIGDVVSVVPRVVENEATEYIDVNFTIDDQYVIYTNAIIQSRAGLLGSTGWLSISNVGTGTIADQFTDLNGSTSTMISQLLGKDAEINITKSLNALRKISEAISNDGGALTMLLGEEESNSIQAAIDSAKSSLESMDSMLGSADNAWPGWKHSISEILTSTQDLPNAMKETLRQVQESVSDVRANVLPDVELSIEAFHNTMVSLEAMSKTFESNSPEWAAEVSSILQNTDQISIRAKKAIDEISASPWRLLYRPTDREIAYEQLNAASWQLLSALTELKESADILQNVSLSPNAPADSSQIIEMLRSSAKSFEEAHQEILDRMAIDFKR